MIGYVSEQKTLVVQVPLKVNEILCRIVLPNGLYSVRKCARTRRMHQASGGL